MNLPPTFDDLRALVRGELTDRDRHALAAWLVEHADDTTARALDALVVEWRELRLDRALGGETGRLSSLFWRVFELGLGDIDPEAAEVRVPLLRGPTWSDDVHVVPRVEIVDRAARLVRVWAPPAQSVIASNDRGDVMLLDPADDYRCEPSEGRTTFWALELAQPSADLGHLRAQLEQSILDGRVGAVRLTDEFFTS